jgi:hypothetical protein
MMQFTGTRRDYFREKLSLREGDESCDNNAARGELYQAVNSHMFDLEIKRSVASGLELQILDRRLEAAQRLLKWLSQALEPDLPASPGVQERPS